MSDLPQWLEPAANALNNAAKRGALILSDGPLSSDYALLLSDAAGLKLVTIDARVYGLLPDGVLRGALRDELGGAHGEPDEAFCIDAIGEGEAAINNWEAVRSRWESNDPDHFELPLSEFDESLTSLDDLEAPAPPNRPGADVSRRVETLARIMIGACDVAPRLVILRSADFADSISVAALCSALASGRGAGVCWLVEGPIEEGSPLERILAPIARSAEDDRFEGPNMVSIAVPAAEDNSPNPPGRGTAAELLALLQAGGIALPEDILGGQALSAYRGQSPRASYQDLEGLLHTGRATASDGWVAVDSYGSPDPGPLARADARALHLAVEGSKHAHESFGLTLLAALALAAQLPNASSQVVNAARELLDRGDALGAKRWLDQAASILGGARGEGLALLRARTARALGDSQTASRLAREAILLGRAAGSELAELHAEAGHLAVLEGDDKSAQSHFELAIHLATEGETPVIAGRSHLSLAELHERAGRYHPGAASAAEAAKTFEHIGDTISAAQAFAMRAICIAGAGLAPRALKELKHAMKRTPDPEDPRPGALDVRIAMGLIFREAGDRDKARQALGLAARRAKLHGLADREAIARLNLARFHLEALPVRGAERGEALSAGREAAEAAIQRSRGAGRPDLEAEAEALLGELAWRSEDWDGARTALGREQELWNQSGNTVRVVDVLLRRGQLASRRDDWQGAFDAANTALTQAQRKRLTDKQARAYMIRGDALQKLERKDEALQSFQEAQRIFGSLGESYQGQAGAAERRAQQLVAGP